MTHHILILNAGSSSLKFALFDTEPLKETVRGQISGIGARPMLEFGGDRRELPSGTAFHEGLELVRNLLEDHGFPAKVTSVLVGIVALVVRLIRAHLKSGKPPQPRQSQCS